MQMRTTLRIALVGMWLTVPVFGQEDPHANCATMGWVPREILERPLPLRPNTGNSADKVTTKSPDALAYEAMRLMEDRPSQISVLPVVDGDERCIGLLRIHDIVRLGL